MKKLLKYRHAPVNSVFRIKKKAIYECVPVFLLLFICSCAQKALAPSSTGLVERAAAAMGSEIHLTAWTADEPAAVAAFNAVFQEMERLENVMSTWREQSDIARLNAAAGLHPVQVSTEVRDVLQTARQV